ncbi:microspherule protein 1-like [Culicoides brevitarsis]|uniref:microspherule protein 1-like n=1 Tax=Culicoides brevitarsis TaxID=469753 RepID=UPI00307B1B67
MPKSSSSSYKNKIKLSKKSIKSRTLGRWKPIDDYLLIENVLAVNDLATIHAGIKFSCHFSLEEIKERWALLMYNKPLSGLAIDAMRRLHTETIEYAERTTLFSENEENCIKKVTFPCPDIEDFEILLRENAGTFHRARKAEDLFKHHELLREYGLLPEQIVTPLNSEFQDFSEMEEDCDEKSMKIPSEEQIKEENLKNRRKIIKIRELEADLEQWMVTSVTAINGFPYLFPEMDSQTFAMLRGRIVKYHMKHPKITFGRNTEENYVDMDFSSEGLTHKVSRRQGTLKLTENGKFWILNEGKRAIFVNGIPILPHRKGQIRHNSLLEICGLYFLFLVNHVVVDSFVNLKEN